MADTRLSFQFGDIEVSTTADEHGDVLLRIKSTDAVWTFDTFIPRKQALQLSANLMTCCGVTDPRGEG